MTDITDAEVLRASGEPAEDGGSEDTPEHLHSWTVLGVQPHSPCAVFGPPQPYTIILVRCSECGEPDTRTRPGEWTLEDLNKTEGQP